MKIDFNKSMSMVKKMIKQADKNTLDTQLAHKQLIMISQYAQKTNLIKVIDATKKCIQKLTFNAYSKAITGDFKKVLNTLKNENTRVIAEREANRWLCMQG